MRQIALDTETTGLSVAAGNRLAEIAAIEIIDRKLTGKYFRTYINPECEVDEGAQRVTGLTWQFLRDYPVFKNIMHEFLEFINGAEIIIHNAQFDLSFINHELLLAKHVWHVFEQHFSVIDTLVLARQMHPGQKNNLDALCKRYKIDNSNRSKHGALVDAEILAKVYLAMTAGQVNLNFGNSTANELNLSTATALLHESLPRTSDLPVIHASADELAQHLQYLQYLRDSNGGICVWQE